MQSENRITLIPDSASYAAVQSFLEQRLDEAAISLRVQNRIQVSADEIWSNIVHYSGASQASVALCTANPPSPAHNRQRHALSPHCCAGAGYHIVRRRTTDWRFGTAHGAENDPSYGICL